MRCGIQGSRSSRCLVRQVVRLAVIVEHHFIGRFPAGSFVWLRDVGDVDEFFVDYVLACPVVYAESASQIDHPGLGLFVFFSGSGRLADARSSVRDCVLRNRANPRVRWVAPKNFSFSRVASEAAHVRFVRAFCAVCPARCRSRFCVREFAKQSQSRNLLLRSVYWKRGNRAGSGVAVVSCFEADRR